MHHTEVGSGVKVHGRMVPDPRTTHNGYRRLRTDLSGDGCLMRWTSLLTGLLFMQLSLGAETPHQIIDGNAAIAKQEDPDFAGFPAEHGEKFYHEKGVMPGIGAAFCVRPMDRSVIATGGRTFSANSKARLTAGPGGWFTLRAGC